MAYNLRNRNFLKLLDFTPEEIGFLLDLSLDLKKAKYAGTEQLCLIGKNIALIVTTYAFILLILSTMVPALLRIYNMAYLVVVVLGVDIPLMYVIRSMRKDPESSKLGRLSFILKVVMLVGLLAIYLGAG